MLQNYISDGKNLYSIDGLDYNNNENTVFYRKIT